MNGPLNCSSSGMWFTLSVFVIATVDFICLIVLLLLLEGHFGSIPIPLKSTVAATRIEEIRIV